MNLLAFLAGFAILLLVVALVAYVVLGIVLNKLNKIMYGKGTPMAWIPICNIYLLGKLTVNKVVGWILIGVSFLTATFTTTVNGVSKSYTILPEAVNSVVSNIYSLVVFGLFIYAVVKYNKLKKSPGVGQTPQNMQFQNMQQQMAYQNMQFQNGAGQVMGAQPQNMGQMQSNQGFNQNPNSAAMANQSMPQPNVNQNIQPMGQASVQPPMNGQSNNPNNINNGGY